MSGSAGLLLSPRAFLGLKMGVQLRTGLDLSSRGSVDVGGPKATMFGGVWSILRMPFHLTISLPFRASLKLIIISYNSTMDFTRDVSLGNELSLIGMQSWKSDVFTLRVSCVSCIGRQILYRWATWEARLLVGGVYCSYPKSTLLVILISCVVTNGTNWKEDEHCLWEKVMNSSLDILGFKKCEWDSQVNPLFFSIILRLSCGSKAKYPWRVHLLPELVIHTRIWMTQRSRF